MRLMLAVKLLASAYFANHNWCIGIFDPNAQEPQSWIYVANMPW